MAIKFEVISEYKDKDINLPKRSTQYSAGYDIESAVDITIPSLYKLLKQAYQEDMSIAINSKYKIDYSINEIKSIVKRLGLRVMVPTGLKVALEPYLHLQLHMRSSIGSNCLLSLANGTGIIDADYYNNPDNEGHIHIPLINLSPVDIHIKKGEKIAQGIIMPYIVTDDDESTKARIGGFGSTDIDPHFGIPVESVLNEIDDFTKLVNSLQSNK